MTDAPVAPPWVAVDPLIDAALREDLGDAGDITSRACLPEDATFSVVLRARKAGTLAGATLAARVFSRLDPAVHVDPLARDGARLTPGMDILRISGPARSILSAERVALNFAGRLSGIATATAELVDAVRGRGARITCTRKTTPGLRVLEKYAVRCGGGVNHRFGLYDAVLIKDNHIAANGSITDAVARARAAIGHMVTVEVEIDGLNQLDEALATGADVIMLDNFPPDALREAVARTEKRAVLEASGNITAATVRAVAETGVDMISAGWITHSAPCLDLGLDAD